jgi:hypothetical protein
MKSTILGLSLAMTATLLFTAPAQASGMRCGVHIIQGEGRHGPSSFEVLRKCGEPAERRGSLWLYRMNGKKWQLRFNANGLLLTVKQL